MPTYEYECLKCGRVFEIRQRISEPPLTVCDACGGQVRRLLSAAPFILKGGGWYVTDYPSESRKKALESEKSSGKPADKPAEKSADTTSSSSSTTTTPSTTPPSTTTPKSD
jgi:putative FmdB family regulatory protein